MRTILYAKVGKMSQASDGSYVPYTNVEVIDLRTGRSPVWATGEPIYFDELDTLTGEGWALPPMSKWKTKFHTDRDRVCKTSVSIGSPARLLYRVRGRFELRIDEEALQDSLQIVVHVPGNEGQG